MVTVDVYVDSVTGLAAYEMALEVSAGEADAVELVGLSIDTDRDDYVFGSAEVIALTDQTGGRLGALALDGAMDISGLAYLGTFTYQRFGDADEPLDVAVRGGGHSFLLDSTASVIPSSPR